MSRKSRAIVFFSVALCLSSWPHRLLNTFAQEKYPARPVDLLVPSGPGGGADQIARVMLADDGKALQEAFPGFQSSWSRRQCSLEQIDCRQSRTGDRLSIFMGRIVCSWATIGLGEFKIDDFIWLSRLIKQESAFFVKYDSPIKDAQELLRLAR